ncbi:hypothetical protein [Microlunatus sp. Y2014]|uniref:hypothetical protein n=1 Tax=Microlunatus sp. Y2014 TaxID=3418488 RepID=UPI003DA71F04
MTEPSEEPTPTLESLVADALAAVARTRGDDDLTAKLDQVAKGDLHPAALLKDERLATGTGHTIVPPEPDPEEAERIAAEANAAAQRWFDDLVERTPSLRLLLSGEVPGFDAGRPIPGWEPPPMSADPDAVLRAIDEGAVESVGPRAAPMPGYTRRPLSAGD